MVTYDRVEKALTRLAETDQPCADLKADVERTKAHSKAIHSAIFLRMDGTVKEREAHADNSTEYQDSLSEYFKAIELYEGMRNMRDHEDRVVEVWKGIPQEVRARDPKFQQ